MALPSDAVGQFLSGMVGRIVEIVGEQGGQTLFRYAAREEGKHLAGQSPTDDVRSLVGAAGVLLGLELEVATLDESRLSVHVVAFPRGVGDPIQDVLVGLLEGFMMMRTQYKRFGTKTAPGNTPGGITIEVEAIRS